MVCPFCSLETGPQRHAVHADCTNALKREGAALAEMLARRASAAAQSVSMPYSRRPAPDTQSPAIARWGASLDGFDGFLMRQRGSTLRIDRAAVTAERDGASICG